MNPDFIINGIIIDSVYEKEIASISWNNHPSFDGVRMKNIITGSDTEGRLSCHIVMIDPGCELGLHSHEGRFELHEVISGSGNCTLGGKVFPYREGVVTCIPDNIIHKVEADAEGLLLMAKFSPALI